MFLKTFGLGMVFNFIFEPKENLLNSFLNTRIEQPEHTMWKCLSSEMASQGMRRDRLPYANRFRDG